jgi:hypothetical protein
VFVNVAWDANVPPPPDASNDEIQKAMAGEQDHADHASAGGGGWFVPVVVSEPRSDVDKGQPRSHLPPFSCALTSVILTVVCRVW